MACGERTTRATSRIIPQLIARWQLSTSIQKLSSYCHSAMPSTCLRATYTNHSQRAEHYWSKGFARTVGTQVPKWQYVIDDDPGVRFSGSWSTTHQDTHEWKAKPPFCHDWGSTCREAVQTRAAAEYNSCGSRTLLVRSFCTQMLSMSNRRRPTTMGVLQRRWHLVGTGVVPIKESPGTDGSWTCGGGAGITPYSFHYMVHMLLHFTYT